MGGVTDMTDLEMTRLAAQAMGYTVSRPKFQPHTQVWVDRDEDMHTSLYDPLSNDMQAMALVRRFKLNIGQLLDGKFCKVFMMNPYCEAENTDLNRAIVECCARMQAAKQQTPSVSEHGEVTSK